MNHPEVQMAVQAINLIVTQEIPGAEFKEAKANFGDSFVVVELDYVWNGYDFVMAFDLLGPENAKELIAGVKEECSLTLRDLANAKLKEVTA